MKCDLKRRLDSGETLLGTWVTIGHPDVTDILEEAGFDWIVLDAEHAPLGPESISRMIQSIDPSSVCPLVRTGAVDQYFAKSALDMGAHGVVFPLINNPGEARRAVSFAKYPPRGVRGVAPRKAADYGRTFAEYIRKANDHTVVVAQIETTEALDNLDDIISVDGVDVAFVGPTDLTMSLGLMDDRGNPKVVDAMKQVIRACKKHGKTPGVLAATPEEAERDIQLGFKFVGLGSDVRFMLSGAREFLASVRPRSSSG
jgi:2-keto-3-deoxy-L-rhamnonate aldolase RhmA